VTLRRAAGWGFVALALAASLGAAPARAATFEAGLAALASGDYVAAEAAFQDVLEREPRNLEAMRNLGVAYLAEGRLREGYSTLQTARVLAPDDPRVHFYLAQLYYQAGLRERERAELTRAITLDPGFREAHLQLANALASGGLLYAASFEYTWLLGRSKAAGEAPEPVVLYNLAEVRAQLDRPTEAAALFERYLAAVPTGEQADRARDRLARLAEASRPAPTPPAPAARPTPPEAAGPP
jgi:tetratricopeptide (TPR) repeat protein